MAQASKCTVLSLTSNGHGTVRGAVSTDGVHWTSLGTVASLAGRNAFFPQAAVSPAGTVSVTFDALTQPPADDEFQTGVQTYDNYYVQSPAGGASFTTPLRVSTAPSNPEVPATTTCKSSSSATTSGPSTDRSKPTWCGPTPGTPPRARR